MKLRRLAPLALVCLVGLTAAGCGGDSNSTQTYAQLVSKANAICKTVSGQVTSYAQSKQYDKIMPAANAAQKKLEALKPPSELKDSYAAYLAQQKKAIAATDTLVQALKSGDAAKIQAAQTAGQPISEATNQAALAAGLKECAS